MKPYMCLAACLTCFSLPSYSSSMFGAIEVSDSQLAEMRGRYVLPDRIIHFGVTMSSLWQNAAGQTSGANVVFQVNENSQPSLYVTNLETEMAGSSVGNGVNEGLGQVIGGAGLGEVSGISQSVRSAGDFNEGLNDLQIVITHGAQTQTPVDGVAPWESNVSHTSQGAAGEVMISTVGGGLKMQIDAGSQGMAMQQIAAGSIIQQAVFTGDSNSLRNQTTLNVALRDVSVRQNFVNCTLEQLRALQPAGY